MSAALKNCISVLSLIYYESERSLIIISYIILIQYYQKLIL